MPSSQSKCIYIALEASLLLSYMAAREPRWMWMFYSFLRPIAENNSLKKQGKGPGLHKRHKVYLDLVGVCNYPDSYEDRLTEVFAGKYAHLRLMALDPYDLVLTKLERNSFRDREDVRYLARSIPLDPKTLRIRYSTEMRPYLGLTRKISRLSCGLR